MKEKYNFPVLTEQGRKNLGKVIKYWRVKKNYSMDQLADHIHQITNYKIAKGTISNMERGLNNPDFNTLSCISHAGFLPYNTYQLFDFASEVSRPKELEYDGYDQYS